LTEGEIDHAFGVLKQILEDHLQHARHIRVSNLSQLEKNYEKVSTIWEHMKRSYHELLPRIHKLEKFRYKAKQISTIVNGYENINELIQDEMMLRYDKFEEEVEDWVEFTPEMVSKNREKDNEKKKPKITAKEVIQKQKDNANAFKLRSVDNPNDVMERVIASKSLDGIVLLLEKVGEDLSELLDDDRRDQFNELVGTLKGKHREAVRTRLMKIDPVKTAQLMPILPESESIHEEIDVSSNIFNASPFIESNPKPSAHPYKKPTRKIQPMLVVNETHLPTTQTHIVIDE
jgi:hypothetical protein